MTQPSKGPRTSPHLRVYICDGMRVIVYRMYLRKSHVACSRVIDAWHISSYFPPGRYGIASAMRLWSWYDNMLSSGNTTFE